MRIFEMIVLGYIFPTPSHVQKPPRLVYCYYCYQAIRRRPRHLLTSLGVYDFNLGRVRAKGRQVHTNHRIHLTLPHKNDRTVSPERAGCGSAHQCCLPGLSDSTALSRHPLWSRRLDHRYLVLRGIRGAMQLWD